MASLNPRQQEAVEHGDGPLLIVAGAGSGKTKTLTSRLLGLIERGVPGASIVAITFTNKAAREMASRLPARFSGNEEPFIGTFHSLGARILKREARHVRRTEYFSIFDEDDSLSLIKKILKEKNLARERWNPLSLAAVISRIKNELGSPDELDATRRGVFTAYEETLAAMNAFDFDDLIEKPVRLFRERPEVLERYRKRFGYILVDEFQDVNAAQYEFVKLLAGEHRNLSVVGDDAQSIYGFRGSDFRNFLNFERDWIDAKVVALEQNYRSTQTILSAASSIIARNVFQKPKRLWTENQAGEPIRVAAARTPEEEAEQIADRIRELFGGSDRPAVAILYRTNAQSRPIEQALIFHEIPYRIFGGPSFYDRKEIKDVIAALRFATNPRDGMSAERLQKSFPQKVHRPLLQALKDEGGARSHLELIDLFLSSADYFGFLEREFPNAEERKENVNELIAFAGGFSDAAAFLERVSLLTAHDAPAKQAAAARPPNAASPRAKTIDAGVTLMSIHLAKGLEFDAVFVAGVAEGLLPHHRSFARPEELEEERRLMYVAVTRARRLLTLSFSGLPSRFLHEIPPELIAFTAPEGMRRSLPDEDGVYVE